MDKIPHSDASTLQHAVEELQGIILAAFPDTRFELDAGGDDASGMYIIAEVNLDDPDDVMDLVIERLLQFQVDEALPVYVVPVRTQDRLDTMRQSTSASINESQGSSLHP